MPDFPLHVQVAEALKWTNLHERTGGHWWGREPHGGMTISVPRYDTSWCSSGVLLERMGIGLVQSRLLNEELTPSRWIATLPASDSTSRITIEEGETACQAIAKLIVSLSKQGKLPK